MFCKIVSNSITGIIIGISLTSMTSTYAASNDNAPISKREARVILEELKKIRATLKRIEKQGAGNRAPGPTTAWASSKNRPTLGKKNAPVTIIEYSDYQCPFCKRFVDDALPDLKKKYINTGKVKLVFKDMPLNNHKHARKAAQATQCAGEQGKYWAMHDLLFTKIKQLQEKNLPKYAGQVNLNVKKFKACLRSDRHLDQIAKDMSEAKQAGITGTPTFIIGKTTNDVIKGDVIRGAQPFQNFKLIIDKLLKK